MGEKFVEFTLFKYLVGRSLVNDNEKRLLIVSINWMILVGSEMMKNSPNSQNFSLAKLSQTDLQLPT